MILILGGSRHWLGPIVGAVVYYGLPYIFPLSPLQNQLAIGVLLIVVILVLPQGLVGADPQPVGALMRPSTMDSLARQAGYRATETLPIDQLELGLEDVTAR